MSKTSGMGRSWTSELKFRQWFRWASGDGPLPDNRSRKIMAGTAGLFFVLIALGLLMVGGGGGGAPRPAQHNSPSAQYSTPGISQGTSRQAATSPSITSTSVAPTTTTIAPAAAGTTVAKRTHSHARHAGGRRPHTRASGSHA